MLRTRLAPFPENLRKVRHARIKKGQVSVLFGCQHHMLGNAPVYCELGVVEANTGVVRRRIVRGDFVGEDRVRLTSEEAVGKSDGNEKLVALLRAECGDT